MTIALLDGDIYAFRSSAASENDTLDIAISRVEVMIDNTLIETNADSCVIYLSGPTNFRYSIYPEYKANRIDTYRPQFLNDIKDYLANKYTTEYSDNCEADDLLGIAQCKYNKEGTKSIICSLDKDLHMIPGFHYSFEISGRSKSGKSWVRPAEIVELSEQQANYNFYHQLIIGDAADNIKGAPGVGKVGAAKALEGAVDPWELYERTLAVYPSEDALEMNAKCLWIFRKPNDIWEAPTK